MRIILPRYYTPSSDNADFSYRGGVFLTSV